MKNLSRFSYDDGYIFIGDKNVYISADKDHEDLSQFTERDSSKRGKMSPSLLGKVMLVFTLLFFVIEFTVNKGIGIFTIIYIIIGGPMLALWVYLYLSKGKKREFLIPRSKIKGLERSKKGSVLNFVDKVNKEDVVLLRGLENEDFDKIKGLVL